MAATMPGRLAAGFMLSVMAFALGFGVVALTHGSPQDPVPPRLPLPAAMEPVPAAAATAYATAPSPAFRPEPRLAVALTPPPDRPEPRRAELTVRRGDTLLDLLARAGIAAAEAHAAAGTLRAVANLRRLRAGQRLSIELTEAAGEGPRLARLVWPLDLARDLLLMRAEGGGFQTRQLERPLRRELVRFGGRIAGSLYASARRAGLPASRLPQMVSLLSWDLDLQREIRRGDRFEAVLERRTVDGRSAAEFGELLFVSLTTSERRIEAYHFTSQDGRPAYYDRAGRALRKWLLRTPVDGARLSSEFGPRRHPVLGYTRMHKGVDFAAPTGTPILAAADGVVEFVGRNRGYGRYVRLRHNGGYGTAYAHLSRFAPRLKPGRRVEQGEIIGAVGSSGLTTGPHLHYEVLRHAAQIDPARMKAAFAQQLQGEALRRFLARRDEIDGLRGAPADERLIAQRDP